MFLPWSHDFRTIQVPPVYELQERTFCAHTFLLSGFTQILQLSNNYIGYTIIIIPRESNLIK